MAFKVVVWFLSRCENLGSAGVLSLLHELELEHWLHRRTCINIISAPASASAMAAACPIPLVPPVTRAVWPSREKSLAVADDIVRVWSVEHFHLT